MTATSLQSGLMLLHGNRTEDLRDLLFSWIGQHPLAPLENEVFLVQSNGIAQWLKMAQALDAGIAAAFSMLLPSRFCWQVYRAVLGEQAVPEVSPFDKPQLLWRLMRLLPALIGRPTFAPLQRFLAVDADLRKRYQLAERLADLFDQYQVYRADWLTAWAAGQAVTIDAKGQSLPLDADDVWQAELWQALLADLGGPAPVQTGRAGVHAAFLDAVKTWPPEAPPPVGLPRRVLVFGISALPRQSLEVLARIARWSQVVVCVHNPCEHYWADIVPDRDLLRAASMRQRRRVGVPDTLSPEALHQHAHPLLAAWGKQGRDFIGLLDEYDSDADRARYQAEFAAAGQRIDVFQPPKGEGLLQQLQDDIRALRPVAETRAQWGPIDPAKDDSLRFHIAHSPQREVEVLHDQLLAAFSADPTLRAREVIVMVPDIDAYAAHIQAVFGLIGRDDARHIPYFIADRGQRQHDPLLGALEKLLGLPRSRVAASDVLDLLEVPAVRARFGIDADDLVLLHRWIREANVRWGLDAAHRQSLGLDGAGQTHSWLFGLRRMFLGYAVGADAQPWQDIEPFEEIGGLEAALLGPLSQFIDALDRTWQTLCTPATPAQWCERLRALMAEFFHPDTDEDAYTLARLEAALQRWQDACAAATLEEDLPLPVVAEYWLGQLDDRGLSQRFLAGAVTFATLMPMRAIPFRRVHLLGMNDGDYPRTRVPMDFDLMAHDYRPGDRSRREDDRYLFLEALLAARDGLSISWVGRSVHDNSPRPPSVLVAQLREHLAAGWRLAGDAGDPSGEAMVEALTVAHRLQPFSPAYFPPEAESSRLFSYAREWRIAPEGVLPARDQQPLPRIVRLEPLTVADIARFLRDPVKAFFQQRLNVFFDEDESAAEDQEPFVLDNLQRWSLQDELIGAQAPAVREGRQGTEGLKAQIARIRRRGELPEGALGDVVAEELMAPMEDLFGRYREALARWPHPAEDRPVRVEDPATGLILEDWVRDLRASAEGAFGRVVLESSDLVKGGSGKRGEYSRHTLLRHWVAHVVAHLAVGPLTTEVIGKDTSVVLPPLKPGNGDQLALWLFAWLLGMSGPLPLAVKTGFAWLAGGSDPQEKARSAYEGGYQTTGELGSSPYLRRAYPDFERLVAGGGFERWVKALLAPLHEALAHDRTSQPSAAKGAQA